MVVEYYSHRRGLNWTTNRCGRPVRKRFGPETFKIVSATWQFKSSGMLRRGVGYFMTFGRMAGGSSRGSSNQRRVSTAIFRNVVNYLHNDTAKRSIAFKKCRISAWPLWTSIIRRVNYSQPTARVLNSNLSAVLPSRDQLRHCNFDTWKPL
jgi:hypothetical protein